MEPKCYIIRKKNYLKKMDKQKVLGDNNDTTNVTIVASDDMAKVYYQSGLPDKLPDMTNENLKQNHPNR